MSIVTLSKLIKLHFVPATVLVFIYALIISYYYQDSKRSIIESEQKNIKSLLLYTRALSSFVADVQRPEVNRVCPKNVFSPPLHSSSYITRRVIDYSNIERIKVGLQPLEFKFASPNPLNPLNKANPFEESLFKRLENNQILSYDTLRTVHKKTYHYMVLSGNRMRASCLACHDSAQTAPKEMVAIYGTKSGYGYKVGDLASIISIRMDVTALLEAHYHKMVLSAIFLAIVFILGYLAIVWLIRQKHFLEDRAFHDPMTKLLNRSLYQSTYENERLRCRRDAKYLAIITLDIDFFKQYNDTHGHIAGDSVIMQVANETTRSFSRISDFIFRIGGEEFSIICSAFEIEQLEQMAQHLCQNIENLRIEHPSSEVKDVVTVSVGLGIVDCSSDASFYEVSQWSDEALYRAKGEGRNKVCSIIR